ncbi:hypothetical protein [Leptothrix discophora]|uniref:Uncharacterized protein n=1 Tax=Leptothrix discophora TaxID=89 RepID=A0ABT9G3Y0_LEPDI|nr:hypothetical protein [Leptothrix discophora]MDP4301198.1 hypothetical protein [Leptothrix discophora]
MARQARLMRREVLPFLVYLVTLALATLLIDLLLHRLGIAWIGRWLGIPGTLLIVASFGYSLRKRRHIQTGSPVGWLRAHEVLAWLGSLLVLVHAGIHFNAILGWLAVAAMSLNVISGLTGKFLLDRSRRRLDAAREGLRAQGLSPAELADRTYWDSMTFDAVRQWRVIHIPITLAFALLALAHIVAIFLFWGWA